MKRFNIVIAAANRSRKGAPTAATAIICLLVLWLVTACTATDDDSAQSAQSPTGMAAVTLRIAAQAEGMATRAWQDTNAETDRSEMMFSWVVLITDGSTIKYKYAATDLAEGEAEIDNVCTNVKMPAGTYTAYSFANISEASLKTMLGVSSLEQGTVLSDATVTAATATIYGNGFTPSTPSVGIPMSNKQTFTVPSSGSLTKNLIVVRMLAKMKVSITNETGAAVTVKQITLSDITANAAGNLKLLPILTSGENTMDANHRDIRPNLSSSATTVDFVKEVDITIANNGTKDITFYINESATPTNANGLFYLTLKLSENEYRYALISDNSDHEWNYIARNDYRVIPVVLDNYKFELIPYDFPPIGVYPASVREIEQDLYEMTFHDYGHFHLVPRITKTSTGAVVHYSTSGTTDRWDTPKLVTAATKGGAKVDNNNPVIATYAPSGFYVSGSTATTDASENGGAPVWDDVTEWNGIRGYFFGNIAEPSADWWNASSRPDLSVYHELTVQLHKEGSTAARQMLYRFYMTLSPSQMLNARRTGFARSCQH
jgi:hypothetical protein